MKSELVKKNVLGKLHKAPTESHKGENGVLLVIGGSKKYHGAPLLAIKSASKFVDLVYFYSPERENMELLHFLRAHKNTFIAIDRRELDETINKADCILIGNGMEIDDANKKLLNQLLKKYGKGKRFVLDGGALHLVDKRLLNKNVCITPHGMEYYSLFNKHGNQKSVQLMSKKFGCVILLKSPEGDIICDGKSIAINETGNAGMTKGGTGDVLAGLVGAFSCKNDLFIAAKAAIYLNGMAGDVLKRIRGNNFDADDLADSIPIIFQKVTHPNTGNKL